VLLRPIVCIYFSGVNAQVAAQLTFSKLESAMSKARKKDGYPAVPQTIEEYVSLITEHKERFGRIYDSDFFSCTVQSGGEKGVVFVVEQLKEVLLNSEELHMDGTFKCAPKKPKLKQLFTIMAMHHGVVSKLTLSYHVLRIVPRKFIQLSN